MPGRVVALLLSFLTVASLANAQCNYSLQSSDQFRSSALDLAIDGNDLWVATSYGLSLYDRSVDPPALVTSLAIPGITKVVRVSGGRAYVGSGSTIYVVRKNGRSLENVRGIDAGATVNDILATTLDLYVATSSGLAQYDLLDPLTPKKTPAQFAITGTGVNSLTAINATLYAADSDSTVEIFSIDVPTFPQHIGSVTSVANAKFVETANGKLYVSNGQQTDLFSGSGASLTKLTTLAAGAAALAGTTGDVVFAAGNDRRLRAFDLTVPGNPVELFRNDLAATGGTINRISALASAQGRIYAAAGDIGLVTFNTSQFAAPFPVRAYSTGATTTIVSLGTASYVSKSGGGFTEFTQASTGQLTNARSWGSQAGKVQDGANGFLLTSSGPTITFWTLVPAAPTVVSTATFAKNVTTAILIGTTAYALLEDNTLWSADLSQQTATPQAIALGGAKLSLLAHSGQSVALAELRDDGTTSVSFYATPNFTNTPRQINIPGLATAGGLTLSAQTAALFTFRGINIIDFGSATPAVTVLPSSSNDIPRSLQLSGATLYALTDTSLVLWNTQSKSITRQFVIPADPVAMNIADGSTIAVIATTDGVASIALGLQSQVPALIAAANGNAYYKKISAAGDRVLLFDSRGADVFSGAMHYVTSIRASGLIDAAAGASVLATLSASGVVTTYSTEGAQLAQTTINEGTDAQPLAVRAVGTAVWVSLSKGCLSGGCEKKTLVYDAALHQTSSFSGGVIDVTTNGTRAYVLLDIPAEIRVVDITDPLHPAQLAAHASEGSRPPQSIAVSTDTVYVLGDQLYSYSASSLAAGPAQFAAYADDPTGVIAYVDQRVRIDGSCALVSGRAFSPTFFNASVPPWSALSTLAVPAAVRSVATLPGRIYLLTDDSVEVWSTTALPKPPRRRISR